VYGLVWIGLLAISRIGIIDYNSFTPKAIFVYLINYFSFLIGYFTISFASNNNYRIDYKNLNINNDHYIYKTIKILLIISFSAVLIKWIALISEFGSLAYIFKNANAVRYLLIGGGNVQLPSYLRFVSYASSLGMAAAVFSAFYIFFISSKKIIPYLSIGVLLLNDLTTFGRLGVIWSFMFFVSSFILSIYLGRRRLKSKNVFRVLLTFFIVLLIINIPKFLRSGAFDANIGLKSYIESYFLYSTGSFTAFSEYLKTAIPNSTKGWALFYPWFKLFSRFGLVENIGFSFIYEFEYIPMGFNVFTYLRDIYSDFGMLGIIIVPYLLGVISTFFTIKLRKKFNLVSMILSIYVYMFLIFSVIYNPFSMGANIIGLIASLIICVILSKKGVKLNESDRC
jgi:oligosaccharide repeat unit polymerase